MVYPIYLLRTLIPSPLGFENALFAHFKENQFPKKHFLLNSGQICQEMHLIHTGMAQSVIPSDSKDRTYSIFTERDFVFPRNFFLNQNPSLESIQCIVPCTTWSIRFTEIQEICKRFPEFQDHLHLIWKNQEENRLPWDLLIKDMPYKKRFLFLQKNRPDLIRRVPNDILASYLGMSTKTFYKVRRDCLKRKKNS